MLSKLAYSVEMSFDIPDSEKEIGEYATQLFESVVNSLNLAKDHLDIASPPMLLLKDVVKLISTKIKPKRISKKLNS